MSRFVIRRILKILCIASVLIMMLCLCGCRARLTNNDEVLSAVYNDDEYMQEEYQMRRDALGLGEAKKPIFNGLGSAPEEEEVFDEGDANRLEEYEPLADTPDPDEAEMQPEKRKTKTSRRGSSGGGDPGDDPEEDPEEEEKPAPQTITVTLDPNGGECEKSAITVEIGEPYGKIESLPSASRDGYDFTGWINGEKEPINDDSLVRTTKPHKLYATWKEKEQTSFTVTFDGNGEGDEVTLSSDSMTVQKDGNYGKMPTAERRGYMFKGWFTKAEGGSKVEAGDPFTVNKEQTLYAQWEHDPNTYWAKKLEATVSGLEEDVACGRLDPDDKALLDFVTACGVRDPEEGEQPEFIFITDESQAAAAYEQYPDSVVLRINKDAMSEDEENQNINLYVKWLLVDRLQGGGYDISGVREDLEIEAEDEDLIKAVPKAGAGE